MRVAFVSTYPPRRCGIATFTADLVAAVRAADDTRCLIAAIEKRTEAWPYGSEVQWRIRQGDPESYRQAAIAINASNIDAVCVQHEFGLYGAWNQGFEDHLPPFLEELRKPLVTWLHTVPPEPKPPLREAVAAIAARSDEVIVMVETAARLLESRYGIAKRAAVIPHGVPAVEPRGRRQLKRRLGMARRTLISTFGLVDPRKGLEHMIEAMPAVTAKHPDALYLIVGQTHPELLKKQGESYRNELVALVDRLRVRDHVAFVNQYLTQREVIDYLLATDVYVTPYLDPHQITSGTLAYALGAGKAVASTRYLHAVESLADGRGILVDFRDARQLAEAVNRILGDAEFKRDLELRAYAYGREMAWPAVGRRFLQLLRELVVSPRALVREARTGAKPRVQEPASVA